MQMEINARHFTLGDEQREIIQAAVDKLEKFSPRPVQSLKLTIVHEAGRFSADSVLHLKHNEFRAKGEGFEPELAVAELVESLRKQLAKFKGKISGKQKGEDGGLSKVLAGGLGGAQDAGPQPQGFVLKDMDPEAAKQAFLAADQPFLVFRNSETSQVGVIYRRDNGDLGHMESGRR